MGNSPQELNTTELVERVAATARGHPNVTRLHNGPFGDIGTPFPGQRITGVRITGERIEIGVVTDWGKSLPDVAVELRESITNAVRDIGAVERPIDLTIAEIEHAPDDTVTPEDTSHDGAATTLS